MRPSATDLACSHLVLLVALGACSQDVDTGRRVSPPAPAAGTGEPALPPPSPDIGAAGSGVIAPPPVADDPFDVRVQNPQGLMIELVTLQCAGDCAEVVAVARNGNPPYSYAWEDGSTEPKRQLCPRASSTFSVTATDSARLTGEFRHDPESKIAEVSASVLDCDVPDQPLEGHILVANRLGNSVLELDSQLNLVATRFADKGLSGPEGVAVGPNGEIWVASTGTNRLIAFNAADEVVTTIETAMRLGTYLESVTLDAAGTLYVTGNGNGHIPRWSSTGADLPDVIDDPAFVTLGCARLSNAMHLLVSDYSGFSRGVRELDRDSGALLNTFGTDLQFQEDLAVDGADRVFVAHTDGNEVVVFDAQRKELLRFTTPAGEPEPLTAPTGIALTSDCRILVAGLTTNRIYEWRHRGAQAPEYLRSVAPAGLLWPETIAVTDIALPGEKPGIHKATPSCD